jgi:cytochrome c556
MHHKTLTCATLLAAALLATGCSDSAKDTHPDQPVTKRKALFKQFTGALEPLGLMARERKPYDAAAFKAGTLELQRLSTLPWVHFTADSNYPPTRAKPAVWAQPAEFKQAQADYATALAGLAAAAETGTLDAGRPAVEAVQKACKACHDTFRSDAPGG